MPACPTLEELERLVTGSSGPAVATHVDACSACRERVERLREHCALGAELVRALRRDPVQEPPGKVAQGLEGYELLAEIHRGGQGVVYEAVQRSTKRRVAVKLLLEGAFASPRKLRRFEREVELAASLDHPNIVTVHDGGLSSDGRRFFVMELVEGIPANAFEPASTRDALELFAKICDAVHFAHQRGVLHRDLKPGNVLIDPAGEPHVLDFGMAVAAGEGIEAEATRLTASGEFMGTLAYASPEHVSGDPLQIDVRSDVYSLGVILYELLTGRFPYPVEGKMLAVMRAITESSPRAPSSARDGRGAGAPGLSGRIDADLDTIVLKALAKEKDRRYQSAGALARDVRGHLRGEPIDARRDSTWYVLRKAVQRNKLRASAALGFALVLIGAAVVTTVLWRRAEAETDRAVIQSAKAGEISAFFQNMLESISPVEAKGRAVTVREVLDEASRKLEAEPIAEPEAEHELRSTIGRAYSSLESYREAERHLTRAVELARRVFGDQSLELALDLYARGDAPVQSAPSRGAEADLFEALAILERAEGDPLRWRAAVRLSLAWLAYKLGELEEAETRFQAARALVSEAYGDPSSMLATAISGFAGLHQKRGDLIRAEPLIRQSLDMRRELGVGYTPGVAISLRRLGQVLEDQGRLEAALESFRAGHAIQLRLFGESHPATILHSIDVLRATGRVEGYAAAQELYRQAAGFHPLLLRNRDHYSAECLNNLGVVALLQGDYALAERVQRDSLECYAEVFEHDSFDAAVAKRNLAWTLIRRGDATGADELCRDALETVRGLMGSRTSEEARCLAQIAWIRIREGEWQRALSLAEESLAIRRALHGEEHPDVASSLNDVGWFHYVNGSYAEAEESLRAALAIASSLRGEAGFEVARSKHYLGQTLLDLGRLDEAEPLLAEALEMRRRLHGERHPDVAESMNALGMLAYHRGGRLDEAEELWLGALEILRLQGDDFPRTPWVLGNLGALSRARDDLDAAEAQLDEALERARRTAAPNHPLLAIVLANRALVHRLRGEDAEAEPLLAESFRILRDVRGPDDPQTVSILTLLIAVYEALGETDKVREHRALLPG